MKFSFRKKSLLLKPRFLIFFSILTGTAGVKVLMPRVYLLTKGNFYGNGDETFSTCGDAF
jgi:hypothetical protein